MTVCFICEGSYPYVAGGVSSWIQMLVTEYKDIDFVIWSIATNKEEMHEYKYKLPDNVKEVRTIYINEKTLEIKSRGVKLSKKDYEILRSLILDESDKINWSDVLDFLKNNKHRLSNILMSKDFFNICVELYERDYGRITFNLFIWNLRSMYFPLMYILANDIPEVDVFHSVSTGYAGALGGVASFIKKKPFLLTEHGIYTREREEEIIKSDWVSGIFKEIWISFFYKLSRITYNRADQVFTLFETNKNLEIELGCPEEKITVIPNGVDFDNLKKLPKKYDIDSNDINIGVVARVVPIKDIKTMLLAFDVVKSKLPNAKLTILGPYNEIQEYYEECLLIIDELEIKDVIFKGRVNVIEYLPDFDMMLLTSISEGQPLAVLEGMAAGIPQICTNVGSCSELLYGKVGDELGKAGIIVPIMNVNAIANAIIELGENKSLCKEMGIVGCKRVEKYYQKNTFLDSYYNIYNKFA